MSEQREFVDEETGIKLVLEPEELDPGRVTAYAPDDAHKLTREQISEALHRLLQRAIRDRR
jgi:hypothetical protein